MADACESCSFRSSVVTAAMFACAPFMIAHAPYESTMGLVQKIFYFHVPSWFAMFTAIGICGVASADSSVHGPARAPIASPSRRPSSRCSSALIGLVTGPLWGRKAWGVWWQWDARLTIALLLELIFISAICWCGSTAAPARTSSPRRSAIFGAGDRAVRLHVGEHLADDPSADHRSCRRCRPPMGGPFWFCVAAFMLLLVVLLTLRVNLGKRQAALDELYLADED